MYKQLRRQPNLLVEAAAETAQRRVLAPLSCIDPAADPTASIDEAAPRYAELHCLSNFSFQRGASSARELFEPRARLGYGALAITDECSLAGIVRALEASRETDLKLIVGTEVQLADGPKLVLLAQNQTVIRISAV